MPTRARKFIIVLLSFHELCCEFQDDDDDVVMIVMMLQETNAFIYLIFSALPTLSLFLSCVSKMIKVKQHLVNSIKEDMMRGMKNEKRKKKKHEMCKKKRLYQGKILVRLLHYLCVISCKIYALQTNSFSLLLFASCSIFLLLYFFFA